MRDASKMFAEFWQADDCDPWPAQSAVQDSTIIPPLRIENGDIDAVS